jgi:Bax protein
MFKKLNHKHNLNLSKFLKQNDLGTIPKIFISSLGIILFFYIMPNFIFFFQNESLEFKNNSKAVLAYTLKNDGKVLDTDDILDEKDLLRDIFSLNDLETDTVRLNASTIKQLFEDTDYSLDDVREKKLVKPVALTLLPAEIKMIENTKQRKEFFKV